MLTAVKQLELQVSELKKAEVELRSQTSRLTQMLKGLGRKFVMRLPVSLESLEKGLTYDLIFPEEIEAWRKASLGGIVLDLRSTNDYVKGAIPESVNIPYDRLAMKLDKLSRDQAILLVCENGIKSVSACEMLNQKGYPLTYVLKGGMSFAKAEATTSRAPETIEASEARAV